MRFNESVRRFLLAAVASTAVAGVSNAAGQTIETPASLAEHQRIDAAMGVLGGPVWRPVWFNRDNAPGAISASPFYKQQPPGAQEDFRVRATPATPVVTPAPPRQPDRPDTSPDDDPEPEIVTPPPPQEQPAPEPQPDINCQLQLILC